jgi:hypothetical protein
MGGSLKLAEKPIELRDTESPAKGMEGISIGPEPLKLSPSDWNDEPIGPPTEKAAPNIPLFGSAYNDTTPSPGGTGLAPTGAVRYFSEFPPIGDKPAEGGPRTPAEELYASIEAGALRVLALSMPTFGGMGGLFRVGLDVFATLRIPTSTRLFRLGETTAVLGKGSWVGHDRIQSASLSPDHVKITQSGKGLKIEDVSGQTKTPLWVGEPDPATGRTVWKKVLPGEAYQTHGEGMVQIAVGPITLNEKGEPNDFKGAVHLGINNQMDVPRIFQME